ncbi:MAG TPA: hypothetical protein VGS20_03565 [Candidatus Acidoferrales bacterium]|nr:hypothetical protein [Candidatus Acidoferrales bacterium]
MRFADFVHRHRRLIYGLMAITLVVCLLCPYLEWSVQANQSIFRTGKDTETTVAVLTLSVGLAFAVADFVGAALRLASSSFARCFREMPHQAAFFVFPFVPLPAISPPSNLRI